MKKLELNSVKEFLKGIEFNLEDLNMPSDWEYGIEYFDNSIAEYPAFYEKDNMEEIRTEFYQLAWKECRNYIKVECNNVWQDFVNNLSQKDLEYIICCIKENKKSIITDNEAISEFLNYNSDQIENMFEHIFYDCYYTGDKLGLYIDDNTFNKIFQTIEEMDF